nr:protein-disulfide reductase DsbD domain-containing protein [uncultured Chitinophaga sp.]
MKYLIVSFLVACSLSLQAQISNPVKWTFSSQKIASGIYELQLKANIERGWHVYAQQVPENTVDPTVITFSRNPLLKADGKTKENGRLIKTFDKSCGATLPYYEHEVSFVQRVSVKGTAKTKMKGMVRFMVCNDHECLPAKEITFDIPVGG